MDTNTYKSEKQGLKCKPKARDWCALKKKKQEKTKQNKNSHRNKNKETTTKTQAEMNIKILQISSGKLFN